MSWPLASLALLALVLALGLRWYERSQPTAKVLALVATLAALAALGRVAFAPLPSVKPTTDIVLIAGYVLGGAPGFAVGAIAALTSNLFFGQGPFTPWQMAGWGAVGLLGGALARLCGPGLGRWPLAAACGLAGLAFGAWMDLHLWVLYSGEHSATEYALLAGRGLPFNIAHAVGNVLFCLAFGPLLVRSIRRLRDRFEVRWAPAGTGIAAAGALALVLAAPAPPAAAHHRESARAAAYLERVQHRDGGLGADRRARSSSPLFSDWAAIGLAAAGRHPADVRARGGRRSLAGYVRALAPRARSAGDLERSLLALAAAGQPTGRQARRLLALQRDDGSWDGLVNATAFAVLALRGAGRPPDDPALARAARWLTRQANDDGGFDFAGRTQASDVDDTAAVVEALAAVGRRDDPIARRALGWLVARQNRDGGFPLQPRSASNAQSTAFAVQAVRAAGRDPRRLRRPGTVRSPLAYLVSLQRRDGSIRYSRTSGQTPTWVTAQALAALARRPLPVAPPPRRSSRTAALDAESVVLAASRRVASLLLGLLA